MNHSFHIEVVDLHWLDGCEPETDLCSHGHVRIRVGDRDVVTPADGEFTLSAAGLHLLRTVERDHTEATPVGEHLLPCCGNSLIESPDLDEVLLLGCPSGIDWWVRHDDGNVHLSDLRGAQSERPLESTVSEEEYEHVVRAFAMEVWEHFEASEKRPLEQDRQGLSAFLAEYEARLTRRRRPEARS